MNELISKSENGKLKYSSINDYLKYNNDTNIAYYTECNHEWEWIASGTMKCKYCNGYITYGMILTHGYCTVYKGYNS